MVVEKSCHVFKSSKKAGKTFITNTISKQKEIVCKEEKLDH